MSPHIPKWIPTLEIGVLNLQRTILGAKTHWIEDKLLRHRCLKWVFITKLWSKEGLRVKVSI